MLCFACYSAVISSSESPDILWEFFLNGDHFIVFKFSMVPFFLFFPYGRQNYEGGFNAQSYLMWTIPSEQQFKEAETGYPMFDNLVNTLRIPAYALFLHKGPLQFFSC